MINVILSDEHEDYINAVAQELNQYEEISINDVVYNPVDTIKTLERYDPDIVILDHMNLEGQGLRLVREIQKRAQSHIVVISDIEDDTFVTSLVNNGVAYYLVKPFQVDDLVRRIKYVNQYCIDIFNYIFVPDRERFQQIIVYHLNKIGIPPNFKGHHYLIDAILLVNQDNSWLNGITRRLYPIIARNHHTNPALVERSMRYAIDKAWATGRVSDLEELFPYTIDPDKGKPTNSAFIAKMADIINFDLNKND